MAEPTPIQRMQREAEIAARELLTAASELERIAESLGFTQRGAKAALHLIAKRLRNSSESLIDEARAEHTEGVRLTSRLGRFAVRAARSAITVAVIAGAAEGGTAVVAEDVLGQLRGAERCLLEAERSADTVDGSGSLLAGLEADPAGAEELDHITRETLQDLYDVILGADSLGAPALLEIGSEMQHLLSTPPGGGGAFSRLDAAQALTMDVISVVGDLNSATEPASPEVESVLTEAHQAIANLQRYEMIANRGRT